MIPDMMRVLHAGYEASLWPSWRRFERAAADPARAQHEALTRVLRAGARTAYGRAHGLAKVRSLTDYQRVMPITDGDAMAPWVARVAAGERDVLWPGVPRALERTSGSSGVDRCFPYTAALLDEFGAATKPWLYDMIQTYPALRGTASYWSISPATRAREVTAGGMPIGLEDDTAYFSGPLGWAIRQLMATPPSLARHHDMARWRQLTLTSLIGCERLGLISVWSPSFLTRLMEALEARWDEVLSGVPLRRAREVERAQRGQGVPDASLIWPRLALVSCWCDGPAARLVAPLRRWFARAPIQGKGLLATEGVVSVPIGAGQGAVFAAASHLVEFVEVDAPQARVEGGDAPAARAERVDAPQARPVLADALVEGRCYTMLLSTGGGLYRYALRDVVRCVGFWRRAPRLRFEGKLDLVSDLAGEKLDARAVDAALHACGAQALTFAMVVPHTQGARPHYLLLAQGPLDDAALEALAARLEARLCLAHHYAYCRALGQLGPLAWRRVSDGARRYQQAQLERGQRLGDIKPTALHPALGWGEVFA